MTRALVGLLLLAGATLAQERPDLAAADIPDAADEWYGMYARGRKVGWARGRGGRLADGRIVQAWTMQAKLRSMGEDVDLAVAEESEFDPEPPFRFRGKTTTRRIGANRERTTVERAAGGYRLVIESASGRRTLGPKPLDYTFADNVAQVLWIRRGVAKGAALTVHDVDFDRLEMTTLTYRVDAVKEALVGGVSMRIVEGRSSSPRDGEIGTFRFDAEGGALSLVFGGLFELRREDEATAKRIERSADLFVFGSIRIDRPLGAPGAVTELVVEVTGEAAAKLPDGSRQTVERRDGKTLLRIGRAHGRRTATPAEIAAALEETVDYPIRHPRIVALAKEAVGGAGTDRRKLQRLVKFVSDYVADARVAHGGSALDVAESRRGDCTEHATLLTALARAAGLPARTVSGVMYMGDDVRAFGGHAWNELCVDGRWVQVDAAWTQYEVDATHIAFGTGDEGAARHAGLLGRLEFKLVSMRREERTADD